MRVSVRGCVLDSRAGSRVTLGASPDELAIGEVDVFAGEDYVLSVRS